MALTVLIPAFIFFLLSLYLLSRENYTLLRKNVSVEQMFNIAFIGFFIAVFIARVIFVIFHWRFMYTNPLVFLLFPYFPGLSLAGGIVGLLVFLWLASIEERMPLGNIFDIFTLSFLTAYLFSKCLAIFQDLIRAKHMVVSDGIIFIVTLLGFILAIRFYRSNKWKDGLIGLFALAGFSLSVLLKHIVFLRQSPLLLRDDILYVGIFILSVILIIGRSNAFDKRKNI